MPPRKFDSLIQLPYNLVKAVPRHAKASAELLALEMVGVAAMACGVADVFFEPLAFTRITSVLVRCVDTSPLVLDRLVLSGQAAAKPKLAKAEPASGPTRS